MAEVSEEGSAMPGGVSGAASATARAASTASGALLLSFPQFLLLLGIQIP